ncbi:putative tRNA N6-adenosine threonylcarbamoyltransferase, mitochondrial [Vitis vinifera]|uniref:N(6)-L-threonylcarbamoyladenine synthase n=1 Tax=Vitis vinifera TaxID=29760 RepID=A0A438FU70_VITVI|nr:putative tRNA N6-adenosine threonylcarbamoyltransferase, mitochondrial [Vitis vinifera]
MVSLATSTFSRNLFPRPSLPYVVRALGTTLLQLHPKPTSWGPLSSSWKSCSAHFSASSFNLSKSQNETLGSQDDLVVLGIETSCDDTAAAIVRSNGDILSQVVSSQADLLARYGGVAPKMAEGAHMQVIDRVVQDALENANLTERDLSAVAVTIGPGLSLCFVVIDY